MDRVYTSVAVAAIASSVYWWYNKSSDTQDSKKKSLKNRSVYVHPIDEEVSKHYRIDRELGR